MKELIEYGIDISPCQCRKMKTGGAITFKPKSFSDSGKYMIAVEPATSRKIETALRRNKGVRVALKNSEQLLDKTGEIIGGASVFKSLGKKLKKTGEVIKRGFNKEIVDKGVGKEIAKSLIRAGTQVVLPAATSGLSMLAGDPTGTSGAVIGNIAGNKLEQLAERSGYGVFKALSKVGISKKRIVKNAKEIGKSVVKEGAKIAGEAISAYTGNPKAGKAFEKIADKGAMKAIENGSATSGLKEAVKQTGKQAKKVAMEMAVEAVDDIIDTNLTGAEKKIAEKVLAGKYPSAKDLVYDIADVSTTFISGYGMKGRSRRCNPLKKGDYACMGMGMVRGSGAYKTSPCYVSAMNNMRTEGAGISGIQSYHSVPILPPPDLNNPIQTGSPYQRLNSPAMNPFIAVSPQLDERRIGGQMGGSFLPR